ncbi:MAG TPA: hypothetical protein VIH99_14265 [Bdellovibrionota bacterium]|jgi:hypothetical protein
MKTLSLFALFFSASAAQAALPPTAESLRVIAAIAQSSEVYKKMNGGWVNSITQGENDMYDVVSKDCHLGVKVTRLPNRPRFVGPNRLKIEVGQLNCIPQD